MHTNILTVPRLENMGQQATDRSEQEGQTCEDWRLRSLTRRYGYVTEVIKSNECLNLLH